MARLRPQTIRQLHDRLADVACAWDQPGQPESLRRYVLAYGAVHLGAAKDHQRLWDLLQSESYRQAQVEESRQYEAPYRALREGIKLYVARDGTQPDDDPRLCWLSLRAGRLANEAESNVHVAFEWVMERPLHDVSLMEEALERISILDETEFYKAAWLLLWIETDRQAAASEAERFDAAARLVLEAVDERILIGGKRVDWSAFMPDELTAWLALHLVAALPALDVSSVIARASNLWSLVEALIAVIGRQPVAPTAAQVKLILTLLELAHAAGERSFGSTAAELLTALASILLRSGDSAQARQLFERSIDSARSLSGSYRKSESLCKLATALCELEPVSARQVLLHRALEAANDSGDGSDGSLGTDTGTLAAIATGFVQAGAVDAAVAVCESARHPAARAEAFARSAQACAQAGLADWSATTLQHAIDAARGCVGHGLPTKPKMGVVSALGAVIDAQAAMLDSPRRPEYLRHTLLIAREIENTTDRSRCLARVAEALVRSGASAEGRAVFQEAQALAESIRADRPPPRGHYIDDSPVREEPAPRSHTLSLIATSLARAGQFRDAFEMIRLVHHDYWKREALQGIVEAAAGIEGFADLGKLIHEALAVIRNMSDGHAQQRALSHVAALLATTAQLPDRAALHEHALAVADGLSDNNPMATYRSHSLVDVAKSMYAIGDVDRAQAVLRETVHPGRARRRSRFHPRRAHYRAYLDVGDYDSALRLAATIDDGTRNQALLQVALGLVVAGRHERAQEAFRWAIGGSSLAEPDAARDEAFAGIARSLFRTGDARAALTVGRMIAEEPLQSRTLNEVVGLVAPARAFDVCLDAARHIREPDLRSTAYRVIALGLMGAGLRERARAVLEDGRAAMTQIGHEATRSSARAAIAKAMIQAGYPEDALACFLPADPISFINESADPARALLDVTRASVRADQAEQARDLFLRILTEPDSVGSDLDKAKAIARTGAALARVRGLPNRDELIETAVATCGSIRDLKQHCEVLVCLANQMSAARAPERAVEILHVALRRVPGMRAAFDQAMAYVRIVEGLHRAGRPETAHEVARATLAATVRIRDGVLRCDCYVRLADALSLGDALALRRRVLTAAHDAAGLAGDASVRACGLVRVADCWVRAGFPARALQTLRRARAVARLIRNPAVRSQTLVDIADAFVRAGDSHSARRALHDALKLERLPYNPSLRAVGLVRITDALFRAGSEKQALLVFEEAAGPADGPSNIDVWSTYVTRSAIAGEPYHYSCTTDGFGQVLDHRARQFSESPAPDVDGSRAIAEIVKEFIKAHDFDAALTGIRAIASDSARVSSRLEVAAALVDRRDVERARRLVAEARADADDIDSMSVRSRSLRGIAEMWLRLGDPGAGLRAALDIPDPTVRCKQLLAVADVLARSNGGAQARLAVDHALAAARATEHPGIRADNLVHVASAFHQLNQPTTAFDILGVALEACRLLRDPSGVRASIARAFAAGGDYARAKSIVLSAGSGWRRSYALADLAEAMIHSGDLRSLRRITRFIQSGHDRRRVAESLAKTGRFDAALAIAHRTREPYARAVALTRIAEAIAGTSNPERARSVFDAAIAAATRIDSDYYRSEAAGVLSKALVEVRALRNRAPLFERVLGLAHTIADDRRHASVTQVLAGCYEAEGPDAVMTVVGARPDNEWKAGALTDLGQRLAAAGDWSRAMLAFERAVTAARAIASESHTTTAVAGIVDVLIRMGMADQALATARTIVPANARFAALDGVATALVEAGRLEPAREILHQLYAASAIVHPDRKLAALAKSGELQARKASRQYLELAELLLDAARAMGTDALVSALGAIIEGNALDRTGMVRVLSRALFEAQGLEDVSARTTHLVSLAKIIAGANAPDTFHRFAEFATLTRQTWQPLLAEWRQLMADLGTEEWLPWIRRSLLYHPFSAELAFAGVRALHLAHLQAGNREVFEAIIRQCPQVGLSILLREHEPGHADPQPNGNPR